LQLKFRNGGTKIWFYILIGKPRNRKTPKLHGFLKLLIKNDRKHCLVGFLAGFILFFSRWYSWNFLLLENPVAPPSLTVGDYVSLPVKKDHRQL